MLGHINDYGPGYVLIRGCTYWDIYTMGFRATYRGTWFSANMEVGFRCRRK